ncbi:hypothetical protein MKK88_19235 [Methylobacterium sp. E-005]|uniref:hypothetical protein n=1 Tax=Methylobacterium sp. E-005 TaxID=2836549 RepID=UPI001FB8F7A6|nr:hypothetical protein [Methylobacterium sp. E-005]MCJ2088099.1 hypothetical protein [Methylobacterium sp. E-005]
MWSANTAVVKQPTSGSTAMDSVTLSSQAAAADMGDDPAARASKPKALSEPARAAIVQITLAEGTALTDTVLALRGTADNPMPRADRVATSRDRMAPVLARTRRPG